MNGSGLTIDSNVNRLVLHFDEMPGKLKAKLKAAIAQVTHELLGRVKAAQPIRTGRLRSSTHAYVDEREDFIRGRVRVIATGKKNEIAAAFGALEYGGPGARRAGKKVKVRAYSRGGVRVRAFERRQPHIRARRFLRGPMATMRPQIRAQLEAAIGQAINEFDFDQLK